MMRSTGGVAVVGREFVDHARADRRRVGLDARREDRVNRLQLARASIRDIGAAERAIGHPLPTLLPRCCSNWVTAVSVADRQQRLGALNLIRFRFHRLSRNESAQIRNHLRSIRLLDEPRVSPIVPTS
jgi:hypothetical protein